MADFLKKLFGRNDDDYDYDYGSDDYDSDYEYDDDYDDEPAPLKPDPVKPMLARPGGRVLNMSKAAAAAERKRPHLVIMEPSDINSAKQVCDFVRAGRTVICNIERIDPKVAQRVIDYLTGAAYAMDGNVTPVSSVIFAVTPQSTLVSEATAYANSVPAEQPEHTGSNVYAR